MFYNYAVQKTVSSGVSTGLGASFGFVFSVTDASSVSDLEGESSSWGGTSAGGLGVCGDYIEFQPSSNPQKTCHGLGVAICFGAEVEGHAFTNNTKTTHLYQPLVWYKEKLNE